MCVTGWLGMARNGVTAGAESTFLQQGCYRWCLVVKSKYWVSHDSTWWYCFCFILFETGSCTVGQAVLALRILLLQSPWVLGSQACATIPSVHGSSCRSPLPLSSLCLFIFHCVCVEGGQMQTLTHARQVFHNWITPLAPPLSFSFSSPIAFPL